MQKKSILITGTSSGIGKHTALALKDRDYQVFAAVRTVGQFEELKALGLHPVILDVTNTTSMQTAIGEILNQTGGTLDALFNNAGILRAGAIEDLTRDMVRHQFETNVFGPMELIRMVLPIMRRQGHGRIIQNSSILGIVCIPMCGAYNASKFALEGFSNTLRQELRGTNIHVSILNPGPIESKLRDNAYQLHQEPTMQAEISNSQYKKNYTALEKYYFHPDNKKRGASLKPEAVIKKVIHALESKKPKAHYFVGGLAVTMAVMHRLFPERVMDWLLTRFR